MVLIQLKSRDISLGRIAYIQIAEPEFKAWSRSKTNMEHLSFAAAFHSVAVVFVLGATGFIGRKARIISHAGIGEIARLLIYFVLPASLFQSTYSEYSWDKNRYVAMAGLAQVSFILVGFVFAWGLHRLLRARSQLGTIAVLSSMQNNIYLALPVALVAVPAADAGRAGFYVGCFVMFFTPVLWSVGVLMLSPRGEIEETIPGFLLKCLNPPLLGAVSGIAIKSIFLYLGWQMPSIVLDVAKSVSGAMTPLAMTVVGGLLADAKWAGETDKRSLGIIALVKLLIIPGLALLYIRHFPPGDPVFASVLLVQSTMPPATNITLVVKRYGGNTNLVVVTLFVTYILSIATIPLWLHFK